MMLRSAVIPSVAVVVAVLFAAFGSDVVVDTAAVFATGPDASGLTVTTTAKVAEAAGASEAIVQTN